MELESSNLGNRAESKLLDDLAAQCFRLLAEHGKSATFDPQTDQILAEKEYSPETLHRAQEMMDLYKRDFQSVSRHAKTCAIARDVLGDKEISALRYVELRQLFMKGKVIAIEAVAQAANQDVAPAVAATRDEIVRARGPAFDLFSPSTLPASSEAPTSPQSACKPETRPQAPGQVEIPYDPDPKEICKRLVKNKEKEVDSKGLNQLVQVVDVFTEITGLADIRELRQHHLSLYVETLAQLPKAYRKSPADRKKPLSEILAEAAKLPPEKKGMATNTINRNLTFIGMLLQKASSEGHDLDSRLDITALRKRRTRRQRDERNPFTRDEIQALFESPLWTGCQGPSRRRVPGNRIIPDGRYWVPLICALSGARREEIAGMTTSDIKNVEGTWCFDIRPNKNRCVKNLQSERLVPIHSQLIELGLLEHRSRKKNDLFPELRPKSKSTRFGDQLDHTFRMVLQDRIRDRDRKTFHSLRHYVSDVLKNDPTIKTEYKDDILGHAGKGTGARCYGGRTELKNLVRTIEKLPRIAALEPQVGKTGKR
ncbi:hypothetical protein CKO19_03215 [Rhodovulum adriaticum]|nr:hypothetical protein [Rhodovulum adriaticum]